MKFNSIVFRMLIPLIAVTTLVVGATLIITQTYLKQVVEEIFINQQVEHFEQVYNLRMQTMLSDIVRDGRTIAGSYEVNTFLYAPKSQKKNLIPTLQTHLEKLKSMFNLDTIYVADAHTKAYYNEHGFVKTVDPSSPQSGWFLRTLHSKKRYLINTDTDITNNLHIWIDTVVGDIQHPIGLAGGGIDVNHILNIAFEELNIKGTHTLILNNQNIIKTSSNRTSEINKTLQESDLATEKIKAIESAIQLKQKLRKYESNGMHRYLLFLPIQNLNWTIVIDFSRDKFLSPLHGVYDRIITGAVVLLFFMILVGGWILTYMLSKPLKHISDAVSNFDFTSDFHPIECKNTGYEVNMICDAFNHSSQILRATVQKHKESEELLRNIIDAADDLIFYKDAKLRYLGCNKAYEKWISKTSQEIIGKTDLDLYAEDIATKHTKVDKHVLKKEKTVISEEKFKQNDGSIVIFQVKKSPFFDAQGRLKGVVVVSRDITVTKQMESNLRNMNSSLEQRVTEKTHELLMTNNKLEEHIVGLEFLNSKLLRMKEKALQAAQARSNFISSISHELRTPLNAIINFTDQVIEDFDEMLEDEELQEETIVFLNRIMVNSTHLLQLINDLLEFTKAEAGKMDYKIETQDINETLKLAYNNTYSLLNGTDVAFLYKPHNKPLIAAIDSRRFLQILLNLLSNAIKFTTQGSIELRSFLDTGNNIIVEVADTGKGIPPEKQKTIFDPFIQVDSSDNGTGLGLGLAKRMCDDMGIYISLVSEESLGTIFRLTLKNQDPIKSS